MPHPGSGSGFSRWSGWPKRGGGPNPEHAGMTELRDPETRWGDYDRANPFPVFAALRDQGAVQRVTLRDGLPAWVVLRYDEAKAALNDPRLSKDMHAAFAAGPEIVDEGLPGPAFARHMLAVDPPDHTRLRQIVAGRFSHHSVVGLEPRVREIIAALLDDIAQQGPAAEVDLMATFAFPMPFTVICEMLGIPPEHRDPLGASLNALLRPLSSPELQAEAQRASDALAATFAEVLRAKEAAPGDDLISDLVIACGQGRLDRIELQSTVFNLIVAGHETTTNVIGNTTLALFRHPELRAALTADPARIPGAIEELLRHDGPAHHATFRFAVEDVELGGVTIPAGGQVLVCLAAANRDERRFEHPDRLDPDRGGPRHLGFGHGVHHCLGAGLARLEATLAIGALLERFPVLRPATRLEDLRWDRGDGIVLRGLTSLPVLPGPAVSPGS